MRPYRVVSSDDSDLPSAPRRARSSRCDRRRVARCARGRARRGVRFARARAGRPEDARSCACSPVTSTRPRASSRRRAGATRASRRSNGLIDWPDAAARRRARARFRERAPGRPQRGRRARQHSRPSTRSSSRPRAARTHERPRSARFTSSTGSPSTQRSARSRTRPARSSAVISRATSLGSSPTKSARATPIGARRCFASTRAASFASRAALVTRANRSLSGDVVYVERGASGPIGIAGATARRSVAIDAIDAATLAIRRVFEADAYALHLAGEHAGELVVYRVDASGTAILGVDERTGAVAHDREPWRRSRAISRSTAGSLVLSNRDGAAWTIERIDLASGARTRVRSATSEQPASLAFGRTPRVVGGRSPRPRDRRVARSRRSATASTRPTSRPPTARWLGVASRADDGRSASSTSRRGRALRLGSERVTRPRARRRRRRASMKRLVVLVAVLFATRAAQRVLPELHARRHRRRPELRRSARAGHEPRHRRVAADLRRRRAGRGLVGNERARASARSARAAASPTRRRRCPRTFPCHVLQAIAMVESGWRQFCVPDTPSNEVGQPSRTIVSFDCGYGVGQVTSGMHVGETPSFDREPRRVRPDVQPRDRHAHPARASGPRRTAWATTIPTSSRTGTRRSGRTTASRTATTRTTRTSRPAAASTIPPSGGSYTYQEKVFGWMEHPPSDGRWSVARGRVSEPRRDRKHRLAARLERAVVRLADRLHEDAHDAPLGLHGRHRGRRNRRERDATAARTERCRAPDAGTPPPDPRRLQLSRDATTHAHRARSRALAIALLALVRRRRFR